MKFNKNIFSAINFMKEHSDGHNARVRRLIPEGGKDQLDPFLLFDSFHVKLPGGFPDHPHRGFETVTYLLSGKFLHEDFKGPQGHFDTREHAVDDCGKRYRALRDPSQ